MTNPNHAYERRIAEQDLGFQDYWINRIGLEGHPLREFADANPALVDSMRYLMWSAWLGGVRWQRDHDHAPFVGNPFDELGPLDVGDAANEV
jgi:hypothetical protein